MSENKEKKLQLIKTIKFKEGNDTILLITLKDEDTGKKTTRVIKNPPMTFYLTKPEYEMDNHVAHMPLDMVEPITVPESDVLKTIAMEFGMEKYFWECIESRKFGLLKKLHHTPNVHGSDIDIEDFYIAEHYKEYPYENAKMKVTKSYFDIEVDAENYPGFPSPDYAECPINALSFFNDSNMTMYMFLLNDPTNPQIDDLKNNLDNFKARLIKKYKDKNNIDISIKFKWFDSEIKLIATFFSVLNMLKPDTCSGWNTAQFDIPYIYNRIVELGHEPEKIICAPDIPYKACKMYIDTMRQDSADNGSWFKASGYTSFLDQLLLFSSLRKVFGKRESYSLDDICKEELGEEKLELDPEGKGITIKNFARKDYERFVEYSIHDTLLLYLLEENTNDINQIMDLAAITATRVEKALTKTISIKNLCRMFYLEKGYVLSNNINANYGGTREQSKDSFRGAFVGNPNLNKALGILINGTPSAYVWRTVVDVDATQLYPSIIEGFNVDETTQIGRIQFLDGEEGDDTSIFIDVLISKDFINLGVSYFNLPRISELIELV